MLKNSGHFDFIDICVIMPVEVKMLFRHEYTGEMLWDMKSTRDKLL